MPIEIRELVIRAVIGPAADGPDGGVPTTDGAPEGGQASPLPPEDFDRLVQACVRQVLAVLARQRER